MFELTVRNNTVNDNTVKKSIQGLSTSRAVLINRRMAMDIFLIFPLKTNPFKLKNNKMLPTAILRNKNSGISE